MMQSKPMNKKLPYLRIIKDYYWLAKPGIVYGNAIAAIAGFFLAARGNVNFVIFLGMLAGVCLVMASGCVVNNVIDRDMDKKMKRTKWRATVNGNISARDALLYAAVLGLAGIFLLLYLTNALTLLVALIGYVFYVLLYSFAKRETMHATLIGSVAGAVPPVVGYTAVSSGIDTAAVLLFATMVLWQMPHFYAIAIYRMKDYKAAGVPVLPIKIGLRNTKLQIIAYIAAYMSVALLLTYFGYTGYIYLIAMTALSLVWLWKAWKGFDAKDNAIWAKKLFLFSLVVLLAWCATISLAVVLP
jgi:heme o synthase